MKSPFPAFWIFTDERGQWSWKFAAGTGDLIAASRHSYPTQHDCIRAIQLMRSTNKLATFATIDEVEAESKDAMTPVTADGTGEELNLTDEYAPWEGAGTVKADAVDHIPYMLKEAGGGARRR